MTTTTPLTWDQIHDLAWAHMPADPPDDRCLGCGEPWRCDGARLAWVHAKARRRLYGDEEDGRP